MSPPHCGRSLRKRRWISSAREHAVEEEPTCGRGLAQNTVVPAGLAAVAEGLARNLELHMRALHPSDAGAAQEREVYERIAQGLRSAAADLQTAAAEMASAVDLPMGTHDMAAITTTAVLDAFRSYVVAEDDLQRLLAARRADNQQMLTAIQAEVEGAEAGAAVGSQDS